MNTHNPHQTNIHRILQPTNRTCVYFMLIWSICKYGADIMPKVAPTNTKESMS